MFTRNYRIFQDLCILTWVKEINQYLYFFENFYTHTSILLLKHRMWILLPPQPIGRGCKPCDSVVGQTPHTALISAKHVLPMWHHKGFIRRSEWFSVRWEVNQAKDSKRRGAFLVHDRTGSIHISKTLAKSLLHTVGPLCYLRLKGDSCFTTASSDFCPGFRSAWSHPWLELRPCGGAVKVWWVHCSEPAADSTRRHDVG